MDASTKSCDGPCYQMGPHTYPVPMELFAQNRARLVARLKQRIPYERYRGDKYPETQIIYLQGGEDFHLYCTDVDLEFRQESYFNWLFGVQEPGFAGAIEVQTGVSILFMPRLPEDYDVWMGKLRTPEENKKRYGVDHVYYIDEVGERLKERKPKVVIIPSGTNTDSKKIFEEPIFPLMNKFILDNGILHPEITECRLIKTEMEIDLLRYINKISSDAHIEVMRSIKPGDMEYQCEAIFKKEVYSKGGCRHVAYTCICGSGENGAILHYGHAGAPNSKPIKSGDMCVFDMGGLYCGYASDITCSFPANGKFTTDQKNIYNAVLKANRAVLEAMKPGVSWVDMHLLANRVMLIELEKAGILQGDIDEMMKANLAAVFQPHGLGHFMGCDVHDVGGYPDEAAVKRALSPLVGKTPPRPKEPGLRNLRTARNLLAGMVITVEPGCYFIPCLLDKALNDPELSKFLVTSEIDRLRNFGGVRIEDDVLVTADGAENLTQVPRTVEEIEALMSGNGKNKE